MFNFYIIEMESKTQEEGKGKPRFCSRCQTVCWHICSHNREAIRRDKTGSFWAWKGAQDVTTTVDKNEKAMRWDQRGRLRSPSWRPLGHINSLDLFSDHGKTVKNGSYSLKPGNLLTAQVFNAHLWESNHGFKVASSCRLTTRLYFQWGPEPEETRF